MIKGLDLTVKTDRVTWHVKLTPTSAAAAGAIRGIAAARVQMWPMKIHRYTEAHLRGILITGGYSTSNFPVTRHRRTTVLSSGRKPFKCDSLNKLGEIHETYTAIGFFSLFLSYFAGRRVARPCNTHLYIMYIKQTAIHCMVKVPRLTVLCWPAWLLVAYKIIVHFC